MRDRGSRFLARAVPATSEAQATEVLAAMARQHSDATHHCFAWRLGWPPRERSSDAGEPGGTAGKPILQVLRGAGLSDVLLVVVRWFGGTKLGKGGLARAYAAAARAALDDLPILERVPTVEFWVEVSMTRSGAVKRLLRRGEVELLAEEYGERARFHLRLPRGRRAALGERLAALGLRAGSSPQGELWR